VVCFSPPLHNLLQLPRIRQPNPQNLLPPHRVQCPDAADTEHMRGHLVHLVVVAAGAGGDTCCGGGREGYVAGVGDCPVSLLLARVKEGRGVKGGR